MGFQEEIRLCPRARVALIVLVTVEKQRALDVLNQVRRGRDPSSLPLSRSQHEGRAQWASLDKAERAAEHQVPVLDV